MLDTLQTSNKRIKFKTSLHNTPYDVMIARGWEEVKDTEVSVDTYNNLSQGSNYQFQVITKKKYQEN